MHKLGPQKKKSPQDVTYTRGGPLPQKKEKHGHRMHPETPENQVKWEGEGGRRSPDGWVTGGGGVNACGSTGGVAGVKR